MENKSSDRSIHNNEIKIFLLTSSINIGDWKQSLFRRNFFLTILYIYTKTANIIFNRKLKLRLRQYVQNHTDNTLCVNIDDLKVTIETRPASCHFIANIFSLSYQSHPNNIQQSTEAGIKAICKYNPDLPSRTYFIRIRSPASSCITYYNCICHDSDWPGPRHCVQLHSLKRCHAPECGMAGL